MAIDDIVRPLPRNRFGMMVAGMDRPMTPQQVLSGADPVFGDRETGGAPNDTAPMGAGQGVADWLRRGLERNPWDLVAPAPSIADPAAAPAAPEGPVLPEQAPAPTPRPEQVAPPPVAAPPVDPNAAVQNGIADKRALLDQVFPQRDMSTTPEQARANDFAQREMERTNLLAQLAFASGLTAAGGGSWEKIGKGFAAAGQTYDQGFERYNKALQTAADQVAKSRDVRYGDELTRSEAAFKLYADEQKQGATAAREADERQYNKGAEFFKTTKPTDFATPEEFQDWNRRYQYFLRTGIFLNDVADK